jgi:hypothetical protein
MIVNGIAKLEVTPKEQVAYLINNSQKFKKDKKFPPKTPAQLHLRNLKQTEFQNCVSNLSEQDIEQKIRDLLKNEVKLQEDKECMISSIKSA